LQEVSLLSRAPSAALSVTNTSLEKKISKIFDKIKHRIVENYDNQELFHIFREKARIVLFSLRSNREHLSEILQNAELLGKNVAIVQEVIQKQNGPCDPRIQEQIENVTRKLTDLKITLAPIQNEMHKEHLECKEELKRIINDEALASKDSKEKKLWKTVDRKIEQSFEKALKESIFSYK
jgi:ribosomal protein L14E/L6E/L27E